MAKKPQQKVVVPLVRLDISPLDQLDLVWRFKEASDELGLRSNFTADPHQATDPWSAMTATPRSIRALSRMRQIDRALTAVGEEAELALRLVFGMDAVPELWPFGGSRNLLLNMPAVSAVWSRYSASISRTKKQFTLRQWLTRIATRYARSPTPSNTRRVDELRRIADAQLEWALHCYSLHAERHAPRFP